MDSDKSYPYGLKSLNECMSRAVLLAQPTDIPKFLAEYTSELSNSERTVDQTDPKVASFRHQEQWEKKYFRTITIKGKRRRDVASARPTTAPEKPSEPSSSQLGPLRRVRTNGASSVGDPAPRPEEMAPIPPATVKEHHPAQKTKTEAPRRASSVPVRKERAVTAAQVPSFLLFRKPAPTPRELRQPQKVTPILPAIVKDRHPTPPKIKTEVAVRVLSRPESSALPPLPRKPGLAPIQQESFTKGTTDVMKIPKPAFPTRKDISTPKSRAASKSSVLPNHSVPPLLRKPTAEKKKKKKKKKKAQKSNRTTSTSKDVSVPISELLARAVQPPLMQEQKRSLLPNRRDDDKTRTDSKPGSKPVVPEPENTKTRLVTTRPPRPQTTKEKGPTTKLPKSEGTVKKVTVITFPSKNTTINWPMTTKVLGKKGTRILPPIMTPLVSESIMGDRTTTKEPGLRDTTKLSPIMNFAGPENTREERPMTTEDQGSEGTWFARVPSPPSTREQPATLEVQEPKSATPVPKGPEMNKTQPASPKVPEPTSTSTWSWFTKSVVGGLDETRQELPMMPKPPGGTRTQLITPLIHVPQTTSTQSVTCSKKMPTLTEDQTAGHKKTCPHGHPVHIIRYRRLTVWSSCPSGGT